MFELLKYSTSISIKLKNGIYVFEDVSGVGKTRLCKLLDRFRAYNEPVASYTYNDFKRELSIEKILNRDFKVILLDRYDMYNGLGAELIKSLQNEALRG